MPSANKLDHTVINVGFEMDPAEEVFNKLGFTLTPRGYHSTGSFNHLMMFGTDYLELLGLPEGGEHSRPDIANAPKGINGLVFKTDDADATYAHLQSVGFDGHPPRAFHRPVDLDGETRDAKFRTVTVRSEVFLGGRVYFCEHGTPELVWRSEWQAQTNATVSIPEFVVASSTPDSEAKDFAKLLNGENEKNQVAFDGGAVTVLSEAQYGERYGALTPSLDGRVSIFGALVFRTTDRDALNNMLNVGIDGAESQIERDRTLVRVSQFDALIEFID